MLGERSIRGCAAGLAGALLHGAAVCGGGCPAAGGAGPSREAMHEEMHGGTAPGKWGAGRTCPCPGPSRRGGRAGFHDVDTPGQQLPG